MIMLFVVMIAKSHIQIDIFKPYLTNNDNSFLSQGEEKKGLPEQIIVQDNCLQAVCAPENLNNKALAVITGQELSPDTENKIIDYTVQQGDTVASIAQDFGISVETIVWANNISKTAQLKAGQTLIILPVTGIMHVVANGENLSSIVKQYQGKLDEVIAFNDLPSDGQVFVGDIIVIPNGQQPAKQVVVPSQVVVLPNSYFICPVAGSCRKSQGLHWYNAVDFTTGECNSAVFAAASGVVQKTGIQTVAGRYVRIIHPNGVVTFYGHLSSIVVSAGQNVNQGQVIGYIGHSGYTIPAGPAGCHLHFDVRGAQNPFR